MNKHISLSLALFLIFCISCKKKSVSTLPEVRVEPIPVRDILNDAHLAVHDVPETVIDLNNIFFSERSLRSQGNTQPHLNFTNWSNQDLFQVDDTPVEPEPLLSPREIFLRRMEATRNRSMEFYMADTLPSFNKSKKCYVEYQNWVKNRASILRELMKTREYAQVQVNNLQNQTVNLSIAYTDLLGRLVVEGWFRLRPLEATDLPVFTCRRDLYIHVETQSKRTLLQDTTAIRLADVDSKRSNHFIYLDESNILEALFPIISTEKVKWNEVRPFLSSSNKLKIFLTEKNFDSYIPTNPSDGFGFHPFYTNYSDLH